MQLPYLLLFHKVEHFFEVDPLMRAVDNVSNPERSARNEGHQFEA